MISGPFGKAVGAIEGTFFLPFCPLQRSSDFAAAQQDFALRARAAKIQHFCIGPRAAVRCKGHKGRLRAVRVTLQSTLSALSRRLNPPQHLALWAQSSRSLLLRPMAVLRDFVAVRHF